MEATEAHRKCKKCGKRKPLGDFTKHPGCRDGRTYECRDCCVARSQRWFEQNKSRALDNQRRSQLRRLYSIDQAAYEAMLSRQRGVCAICGGRNQPPTRRLAVDHDHATGKVRGLLCYRCNSAIGLFDEDAERMQRAIDYVHGGGPA